LLRRKAMPRQHATSAASGGTFEPEADELRRT
jgi:hypothetical protein